MCRAWALSPVLLQILSAPIAITAFLAASLPAANNETVNQHNSISAVPSDPIPSPSSTPYSVPGDSIALQSLNAYHSLSPQKNLTANIQFRIPGSLINLTFTSFGSLIRFKTAMETLELAINEISTIVNQHPSGSITDGYFKQRHEGLVLLIFQNDGKQVTWTLLNQLLLGIQYYAFQVKKLKEMQFEIDVEGQGRVGDGSLWSTDLLLQEGIDVAKRDGAETSQPRGMASISRPVLVTLNHSVLLLPIPDESRITFSYHLYGPVLPESLIDACFDLARQSIRTHVQMHPLAELPGGFFRYRADGSDVSISIHAYADKEISWLLLDDILRQMHADLTDERLLSACEFEFEIAPSQEVYGYGSLEYDPASILFANRSHTTASSIRKTSSRPRNANDISDSPSNATTAIPKSTPK